MPSPRYTVRLPPILDALVQEHIRASGTPLAVLIQEALAAYFADTPPTGTPTPPDSAVIVRELQAQLAALTTRVDALEHAPTRRRQPADRTLTPANTPRARMPGGQRKLTPRQVAALRAKRARGVPIKALMEQYGLSKATVFRYLA